MKGIIALGIAVFAQLGPGPGGPGHGGLGSPRMTTELKMAEPRVTHSERKVDRTIVKRYLRREQNKYRYCYEKALVVDPTLRGTLTIQFRVLPDGNLTSVRVEGIANDV